MNEGFEHVSAIFDQAFEVDPPDPEPDPRAFQQAPPVDPGDEGWIDQLRENATLPLNDYGNGKRFASYFGADCLFVPRLGWFVWDGRYWAADEDELGVRGLAQKVAGQINKEAIFLDLEPEEREELERGPDARRRIKPLYEVAVKARTAEQKAEISDLERVIDRAEALTEKLAAMRRVHFNHAKKSGNTGPINNLMREAQVEKHVKLDILNADKLMVNVENCVLAFREGTDAVTGRRRFTIERQDHARELYLTKIMRVAFDPDATCPDFEAFLEAMQPDPPMREFLQRWFGYSITGLTSEQKLAFLYGMGRNGKSTLVDIIARIMGDYATTVPIESLAGSEQRKGSDATPDLVRLPGARMVRASEPEKGQKMREALIKQLTGGEEILVRRMQKEFFEVIPEFSLTIQGNHKPEIRGDDDGIWRRVLLIPFLVQIAKEDVDPLLPQKLWAERSGILNWLLEGARKWLTDGLRIPQEVLDATEEYRRESDPMIDFLNDCCEIDGNGETFTRSRDLVDAFNWWQEASGISGQWGTKTISQKLQFKAKHYRGPNGEKFGKHKKSVAGFKGIRLTDAFVQLREDADAAARYGADMG